MDFVLPIDPNTLAYFFAGLFFVLFLGTAVALHRKPRRTYSKRYITEIPSKLVIEEDSLA